MLLQVPPLSPHHVNPYTQKLGTYMPEYNVSPTPKTLSTPCLSSDHHSIKNYEQSLMIMEHRAKLKKA